MFKWRHCNDVSAEELNDIKVCYNENNEIQITPIHWIPHEIRVLYISIN